MTTSPEELNTAAHIEKLRGSDTPVRGVVLEGAIAVALANSLNTSPRLLSTLSAAINTGFGLNPQQAGTFYAREQRLGTLPYLPGDAVRETRTTTHNIRTMFTPSVYPDSVVVAALSIEDIDYSGVEALEPKDPLEILASVLQKVSPEVFETPSQEILDRVHSLGLQHPSETRLVAAGRRLQAIPPHSTQKQNLWIGVFSTDAWEAALVGAEQTIRADESFKGRSLLDFIKRKPAFLLPPVMGLDDRRNLRIPGVITFWVNEGAGSVVRVDKQQQYPETNAPLVADKIEEVLANIP